MVNLWMEICDDCPEGETNEEFVRRLGQDFVNSETTYDSGITVPEYPLDCLEYVDSLEVSQSDLALFKQQLEINRAFDQWARPQFEALQARLCNAASGDLAFQTTGIEMMIDNELDINEPIIEDFLFVIDTSDEGLYQGQDLVDYSNEVISYEILNGDSGVVATEPETAGSPLPDFCLDTSSQDDFNSAAQELAAQITRTEWAEYRVAEICSE